jgi:hypothetical protein
MKQHNEDMEIISVRVPASLMREIRILLLDPVYGRIKYGNLRHLLVGLLTKWLEDKKEKLEDVDGGIPPRDRFEVFDKDGI